MQAPSLTPSDILSRVRDLPTMPEVVQDLIKALDEGQPVSTEQLAAKLSLEPVLSAKALRLANSSFYGLSRQVETIPEALHVLGVRTIGMVVMAAAAMEALPPPQHSQLPFKTFWRHALGTALSGQALAQALQMNADLAFTTGLLHDIGRLAMACLEPDRYAFAMHHARQKDLLMLDAERLAFGTDHAAVGALLADHWQFSPAIVEAIGQHHAPALQHGPGLVGLTHLADAISHALGLAEPEADLVPPTPPEVWLAMAPSNEDCLRIFQNVETRFEELCNAMHV